MHAPATDETYHIINADVFKQMKETAYLINVARGSLVDSDAFIAALKKGEMQEQLWMSLKMNHILDKN